MSIKYTPISTFFAIALLLLLGCAKDKGNYEYTTLNNFTVNNIAEDYTVYQGDTLKIEPMIAEDQATTDRFSYAWTIEKPQQGGRNQETADTLSKERTFNKAVGLGPGTYLFKFTMTEKSTGIYAAKTSSLMVITAFESGWVALEETPKGGDLSMIVDGTKKTYHNLFSNANLGKYMPLPLSGLFMGNFVAKTKPVFITANQYNKVLDPLSFKEAGDTKDVFVIPGTTNRVMTYLASNGPSSLVSTGFSAAIINGKYTIADTYSSNELKFVEPIAGDYELAPYAGILYDSKTKRDVHVIFFDKKNSRFIYFPYGSLKMNTVFTGKTFDPLKINQEIVYATIMDNGGYNALFKDSQNTYHLYQFIYRTSDGSINARSYFTMDAASLPNIGKATAFTGSPRSQIMYYAAENQVYMLEFLNKSARPIFSFPAGENITTMEDKDNQMIISTWNGTEGKIFIFKVNDFQTFDTPAAEIYTGFGKIKALKRKFG